jgi:nucleoside 2-deoxyribosyltransferase
MTKRKVYIASSWKNVNSTRSLARVLRDEGHEVYDFTDPDNFVFEASEPGRPRESIDWLEFLEEESTSRAYSVDKAGLDWADTVILFLPAGRSAHLEAGYGVGAGKDLFIYGDLPRGEFDVMYLMANDCHRRENLQGLINDLEAKTRNRRVDLEQVVDNLKRERLIPDSQNRVKCEKNPGEKT